MGGSDRDPVFTRRFEGARSGPCVCARALMRTPMRRKASVFVVSICL
jgi:hypothetical protein